MIGETILHYKITDKLGAGGMGEVYLAHDTRLDREVALKFLPKGVQFDDATRHRFLREARAASKLTHPNIVALYYIEEFDGRNFIVMEYVRGRSLRDVIAKGDVTIDQALVWSREVAGALSAAHSHGIVHRDVKAENVVLTEDGHAKVLDFGLAKLEGATQITDTTSTVGTVAYMSPEQIRGEEVDARSDLFSLGVLLYELVAGRQPFRGDHRAVVTYAIMNEGYEPLARYKEDVPEELQRIVDKALRKDRETRYQSAADLAADLDALRGAASVYASGAARTAGAPAGRPAWVRWTGIAFIVFLIGSLAFIAGPWISGRKGKETSQTSSTPAPVGAGVEERQTMIAVLPFDNLGAADDEYFADGITEEITARLARIRELGVIARTSVLRYKNTELPIQQIAKELGVDYILEGTVRWQHSGGESRVRVTPQLIKATTATHVWADVYDEPLTAVFQVQSDIAGRVIDELNVTLVGEPAEAPPPTENMEAYDAYLRGLDKLYEGDDQALVDFRRAIALDPGFADAYAGLSMSYSSKYWYGDRSVADRDSSRETAERAVAIAPRSVWVRGALGMYYYHCELDYDRALEQFDIALREQPNNAEIIANVGFVQRRKGMWEETLSSLQRASKLDPRRDLYYYEIGETFVDLGRYDEAEWYLDKTQELNPDEPAPLIWKVFLTVLRNGDTKRARALIEESKWGGETTTESYAGLVYHWLDVFDRDYDHALAGLRACTFDAQDEHFMYLPRTQMLADVYWFAGNSVNARLYADSARVQLEESIAENPADSRLYSALGLSLAVLGKKVEAIRAAQKAVEMMPVSKEAKQGPRRVLDLAMVYAMVGEKAEAIDQIEYLRSIPAGWLSVPILKLDPVWDPLRDDPRFQKLVGEG